MSKVGLCESRYRRACMHSPVIPVRHNRPWILGTKVPDISDTACMALVQLTRTPGSSTPHGTNSPATKSTIAHLVWIQPQSYNHISSGLGLWLVPHPPLSCSARHWTELCAHCSMQSVNKLALPKRAPTSGRIRKTLFHDNVTISSLSLSLSSSRGFSGILSFPYVSMYHGQCMRPPLFVELWELL